MIKKDKLLWGSAGAIFLAFTLKVLEGVAPPLPLEGAVFVNSIVETMGIIWFSLLLGMVMVGLLARVPRAFVMHVLGDRGGFKGLARAACGGVLLDLCNHGILMVARKLYERGASAGQMMAFLIASPWNSFSLLLILITLLGFGWAMVFMFLSVVIAMITGLIFDNLTDRGVLPPNPYRQEAGQPLGFNFWREAKEGLRTQRLTQAFFAQLMKDSWMESRMVLRWVLLGVVLTALVRVIFDEAMFSAWFGPTLLGLFSTLLAATFIEICSEGSVPLASDLTLRAGAIGNTFTFLMAGAATDYTEIMIVREATASWKIALFLPLISVPQVVLLGWLLNNYRLF